MYHLFEFQDCRLKNNNCLLICANIRREFLIHKYKLKIQLSKTNNGIRWLVLTNEYDIFNYITNFNSEVSSIHDLFHKFGLFFKF